MKIRNFAPFLAHHTALSSPCSHTFHSAPHVMKRRFPGELEPAAGAGESTPARPVQGSVLPLAKRAAGNVRAAAERAAIAEAAAAEAEAADAAVSVVIQLQEMSADAPAGPTLSVPLNITPAQLEAVVNELLEADEPTPYSFYLNEAEVLQSLKACMTAQGASTEEVQVIKYQPLAVFRVMPVSRCTDSMPGHTGAILHVSFSPDGRMCASGGGDATVRFWDVSTCMPRHTCVGHKNHVLCTAWSPDGRRFASADRNGEVRVWDPETGKEVCKPFTAHTSWVTSLAWEPLHRAGDNPGQQCELLASSSKDKTVRVWNTRTSTCQFSLSGHSDSIECVRWGGEGFIYTASRDRTILVWALEADKTRAKCIRTLSGHGHRINSLALNTDHLCRTGAFDHRGNVYETPAQGTTLR
ncbi:hypothetical protein EON66_01115 [archaeon]|nr:MAG: hypothetical protein EON66_01115 [archaeon]